MRGEHTQTDSGGGDITQYTWDHRNRLVKVEHRPGYAAAVDKVVEYAYDYQNRWVRKRLDADGDGHTDQRRLFVYDGNQIVMDFRRANSGNMQIGHLRERYLWGPAVDQIPAEEEGGDCALSRAGRRIILRIKTLAADVMISYRDGRPLRPRCRRIRFEARFRVGQGCVPGRDRS